MTRFEVITAIETTRNNCRAAGMVEDDKAMTAVLQVFDAMDRRAAAILGAKGGNTPVKPGSRPRGRPKKDAISETPSKAVE